MIVTIDGPAGSGKSTAARKLARRLGFRFIDTGAMYRAVALAGKRNAVDWTDRDRLAQIAANLRLELTDDRILMNGEDVSAEIRTVEITTLTRHAADNQAVRRLLVDLQRSMAAGQNVVTDGRDQATVAFPQAECKFYLTAGEEVRARRRHQELQSRGEQLELAQVLAGQQSRDLSDSVREFGGLAKAADAIEVCTDGMSPTEVVDALERIVREVQGQKQPASPP